MDVRREISSSRSGERPRLGLGINRRVMGFASPWAHLAVFSHSAHQFQPTHARPIICLTKAMTPQCLLLAISKADIGGRRLRTLVCPWRARPPCVVNGAWTWDVSVLNVRIARVAATLCPATRSSFPSLLLKPIPFDRGSVIRLIYKQRKPSSQSKALPLRLEQTVNYIVRATHGQFPSFGERTSN